MEMYELPDGLGKVMLTGTPEQNERHKRMVEARHAFTQQYIKEKGWGQPPTLTIAQVIEIGKQPGWKSPLGDEPEDKKKEGME